MPQYQTWEEFSRAAEKLYLADPMKARVVLKYRHSDGSLCIKVTDDLVVAVAPHPCSCSTSSFQGPRRKSRTSQQLLELLLRCHIIVY
uniref:Signal recognition particle 9 n=1 Tax=Equus caballus TaxID=9796 RepID=A0A9L0RJE2_HORSE